jgi:hypothetical protein
MERIRWTRLNQSPNRRDSNVGNRTFTPVELCLVVLDQKVSGKIYLGFLMTKNASRFCHRTWLQRMAPDLDAGSRSA